MTRLALSKHMHHLHQWLMYCIPEFCVVPIHLGDVSASTDWHLPNAIFGKSLQTPKMNRPVTI